MLFAGFGIHRVTVSLPDIQKKNGRAVTARPFFVQCSDDCLDIEQQVIEVAKHIVDKIIEDTVVI